MCVDRLRLQEKLLANLDEDRQNDAGLTGGDEVPQQISINRRNIFSLHKMSSFCSVSRWLTMIEDVAIC